MNLLFDYWHQLYAFSQTLLQQYAFEVWAFGGIVLLLLWAYISHHWIRCVLGHWKFRGTWYNRYQIQEYINMLAEDQARGHRVMQHDEIELLRRWKYGRRKTTLGFDRSKTGY